MKNRYVWILIVALLSAGGWWWFSSDESVATNESMFLREAVAERGDLVVSITASGRIDPVEQVDIKSKASGEIISLPIEVGDFVRKGDLIVRLDPITAQNEFDQAESDLAVAKAILRQRERERERAASLTDQGLASPDDLDLSVLAYEQANAQLIRTRALLSTARERLDDTEIRSPIDGIVLTRPVETGQVISSGTTTVTGGTLLCTVANMEQVYVIADVDETDIGRVSTDLVAYITPDAYTDLRLKGIVLRIAPLGKEEQNVTVFEVTTLVENEDFLLKAGMNATVEVVIAETHDAILIPARAVQMKPRLQLKDPTDTEGHHQELTQYAQAASGPPRGGRSGGGGMRPAVEVRNNGVTEWKPIRTGLSNYDNVEVIDGLAEGDTVVYNLASGALQSRADFRDRMRQWRSIPGMQKKKKKK